MDAPDIDQLVTEVTSENPLARQRAREALAQTGAEGLERAVGLLVTGKDMKTRQRAVQAVAAFGGAAVDALRAVLDDPTEDHRHGDALQALVAIGTHRALEAARGRDVLMGSEWYDALLQLDDPLVPYVVLGRLEEYSGPDDQHLRALVARFGVDQVLEAVRSLRPTLERESSMPYARALCAVGSPAAQELAVYLRDRRDAGEVLSDGDLGSTVRTLLKEAASDDAVGMLRRVALEDEYYTANAVETLGELEYRDEEWWSALLRQSAERSYECVGPAARAVARMGLKGVAPMLEWFLLHPTDEVGVGQAHDRRAAAEALGQLGQPSSVPALEAALSDPDGAVRTKAQQALALIGDGAGTRSDTRPGEGGVGGFLRRLLAPRSAKVSTEDERGEGTVLGKRVVDIPASGTLHCDVCDAEMHGRGSYANPSVLRDRVPLCEWPRLLRENDPAHVSRLLCQKCFARYMDLACDSQGTRPSDPGDILSASNDLAIRHLRATGRMSLLD